MLSCILYLAVLVNSVHSYLASFYGDSFLFQSLENSHDTTTVSLRFMTSSSDGILFLALGDSQTLLIELVHSRLEVKVDLGYGEEVLSTPEDESLDNLIWHEFKVIRSGSNIKIVLNRKDIASSQIPGPDTDRAKFNLNFGVFLGGIGGNVTLLDGTRPTKFFRGCILNAEMNGHDLLSGLTSVKDKKIIYNVLSGCPKIFRIRSEPVTFDSPSAYIALQRWTTQDEGLFECMVKTSNQNGILLYNAGQGREEFIGLNMVDGVISASVNKGGGVVSLQTTTPINDGRWHSVRFGFSPSFLDIRVDGLRTNAFIEQTFDELNAGNIGFPQRNLDLTGSLYIGGVPDSLSLSNAVRHSLMSSGSSSGKVAKRNAFPGCMKNIKINHRRKVFSDFLITSRVSAGCKSGSRFSETIHHSSGNYQEASDAISGLFAEYKLEKTHSLVHTTNKVTTTTLATTTTTKFAIPEIGIVTKPLSVDEGGSSTISDQEISVSVTGMQEIDIKNSILFVLSAPLAHGSITKSSKCVESSAISEFSLEDVDSELVSYCHDGSETVRDSLNFSVVWNLAGKNATERREIISLFDEELEFVSSGIILKRGEIFVLSISIGPVDDVPELVIPSGYLFHPVKNVKTHLPAAVLNATDEDSSAQEILYSVLGNAGDEEFHLESQDEVGRPVTEFTQSEINANKIVYFHKGQRDNTRLFLGVSNPDAYAPAAGQPQTYVMRIAAVPLNISVVIEEVTLLEKSATILTKSRLSVSSNAEPGAVIFTCSIKEMPSLGMIEVLQSLSDNIWNETTNFTVDQVYDGHVRYRNIKRTHTRREIDQDRFIFTVSGANVESEHHIFTANIKRVDIEFSCDDILLEKGSQETLLTGDDLRVNVSHLVVRGRQMQVRLQKAPKYTEILYNDNGLILDSGDSFTIEEAKSGRISLRVKQKHGSKAFEELIPLFIVINDRYDSSTVQLNVTYLPDLDRILLVNKGLSLNEGKELVLTSRVLQASLPKSPVNDKIKLFHFNVTRKPSYGVLKLFADDKIMEKQTEIDDNTKEFLSTDLELGKLHYWHDDSETTSDYFSVFITPVLEGQLPQTIAKLSAVYLEANVTIQIKLVDDQRPERIINRPFEIARNSERLLTKDDLWYHDADTDYDDLDLIISSRGLTNGDLLNATSRRHEKISRFTQRQIANGEVLVKHRGRDFGRFVFWVRDGKHYSTGLFTLSASDPFLSVVNDSSLSLIKGREVVVTAVELCFKTNVKGLQQDIVYQVTKGPDNGLLYLNSTSSLDDNGNLQPVSTFTQQDIIDRILVYEHSGSPVMNDSIDFRVSAGSLSKEGNITVRVYLESHRKPPIIQKNRTIVVEQGKRIQIRKQDLRVIHPDARAADIFFSIIQQPCMGSLEFVTDVETEDYNSELVSEFTQADINRGLVWYVQNDSFIYSSEDFVNGLLLDYFVFNVSNGILSVGNMGFFFDIVPNRIPLRLGNFSVGEGRTKAILHEYLSIDGPHFDDNEVVIRVVSQPSHGILESQIGVSLKSFSYKLATAEFLYYAHDGSDYLHDNFSLQAFTLDLTKESDVMTVFVNVIPENDEQPTLANNTGLHVWINSATEITSSSLAYSDSDSSPEDVNFRILPPSNGWVAEKNSPSIAVLNFTQAEVDEGQIIFVHKGPTTGGFTFQADDGVNYATKGIFVVTARPLIVSVKTSGNVLAFPGFDTLLPSNTLQSSTNDLDNPNRTVTYVVTTQPSNGKFVKRCNDASNSSTVRELHNFTQNDLDNDLILFHQSPEIQKWSKADSFVVTALSAPAEDITDIKLTINITYDATDAAGKLSPIKVNKGCTVTEGGRHVLNNTSLDARNLFKKLPMHRDRKHYELIYTIAKIPLHGNLSISGKNVTELNSTFTQTQLQSGRVVYTHDHSDTFQDAFDFYVYLTDKRFSASTGKPWIVPGTFFQDTFNITVTPLNDNPPVLITKGKRLKVVDGFESLIRRDTLEAIDPDNDASEIVFAVIQPPTRGKLVFVSDRTTAITKFSQEDISLNRVAYVPHKINITEPKLQDAFYYGLTDGIQRSSYNSLQIQIVPVDVRFFPEIIEVTQAYYTTPLSSTIMNVSTNGNYSLITFFVSQPAKSGVLLVNEEQSNFFTYEDLSMMKVEFAMTDNQLSEDSLEIELFYNRTSGVKISKSAVIDIAVRPLIKKGFLEASSNGLTRIGLGELNASALHDKTRSMPVFEILKEPTYGTLLKLNLLEDAARRKREIDHLMHLLSEVVSFTHEDVSRGIVFLHTKNVNITNGVTLADSIEFRLSVTDGSVQSAQFAFAFKIKDVEAEDYSSFLEQFVPNNTEETTLADIRLMGGEQLSTTISPSTDFNKNLSIAPKQPEMNIDKEETRTTSGTLKPEDTKTENPKPAEASVPWLIPVAVVIALIIILAVALAFVFVYRRQRRERKKYPRSRDEGSDENRSLATQDNMEETGHYEVPHERPFNLLSNKSLRSPACPGVTVTLLRNEPRSEFSESEMPSMYDGVDRNSISILGTQSYRDDPSTAYASSTMYHYDDVGSVDFMGGPEAEFYMASYPERLYHARSAKLIDPDVLALYSSDESIPSIIDEKYAIPVNGVTGSVPSGLHRSTGQGGNSRGDVMASRSTASLSKIPISPELSLLPDSGLKSNQYWI